MLKLTQVFGSAYVKITRDDVILCVRYISAHWPIIPVDAITLIKKKLGATSLRIFGFPLHSHEFLLNEGIIFDLQIPSERVAVDLFKCWPINAVTKLNKLKLL